MATQPPSNVASKERMPPNPPRPDAPKPPNVFPPRRDFMSLGVADLLAARDAYHVHLSAMPNVVATAIGRYLIQEDDWYARHPPDVPRPADVPLIAADQARTLESSVVRPWSWPSVLVFVRKWVPRDQLGDGAVPRRLYLPDGREVPTCVILAPPDPEAPPPAPGPANASGMLGGGYMCLRNGQGIEQVGSVGCLVQREGNYFALTNKHVAGGEGEPVLAVVRAATETIGVAAGTSVTKRTLASLFPGWPGERTFVNLDAGLVRVKDVSRWTAQVFGIGEIGELFDATPDSITLDLIGCPVRAFGAASGPLEGEIRALFFRYQSLGNYDYVSDVFIGPRGPERDATGTWQPSRRPAPETRPGDSGTIWFYDPPTGTTPEEVRASGFAPPERGAHARRLRPIAMQWGGARLCLGDRTSAYALGTFLSTVCRVLDVEIVRDWSVGWEEYWGKIGHFAIGWKACESKLLSSPVLADLMQANQERVGFGDDKLSLGSAFRMGRGGFVPLADVPDYVWVPAARFSAVRRHEPQQHFADVDLAPVGEETDFLAQCVADPTLVHPAAWNAFFSAFAKQGSGPEEGSLPFRVWQLFEAMVGFVRGREIDRFVAAAGILAHYVGDASQPLHCSYLHHGRLPMMRVDGDPREYPVAHSSQEFKDYSATRPAQVHGIYEEGMLEIDPAAALAGVDEQLGRPPLRTGDVGSGQEAAYETVLLMDRARRRLAPADIIDADDPSLGPKARARRLWENEAIRAATIVSLADSVQVLARLWQSAWTLGGGADVGQDAVETFGEKVLEPIYRGDDFLVPKTLAELSTELGTVAPLSLKPPASGAAKKAKASARPRTKAAAAPKAKRSAGAPGGKRSARRR